MSAVIITLPQGLASGAQISVVSREDIIEPDVLIRAASHHQWMPINHVEGTFELRP
jgi:hypothetical protein